MALSIVRSASNTSPGSRSITITLAGTPTNGNLLIFALAYYTGVDPVSTPSGWTMIHRNDPNTAGLIVFRKVASSESATFTFTNILAGSDDLAGAIYEINGQHATTPIDQEGLSDNPNAGLIATTSETPSVMSTLALAFASPDAADVAGAEAVTVTAGWTKDHAPWPDYHGLIAAHRNSLTSDTSTAISATFDDFSAIDGPKVANIILIAPAAGTDHSLPRSDTATASEAVVKSPGLNKADSATATDARITQPTLAKSDSVTPTDARAVTSGLGKTDSATATDSSAKAIVKNLSDSATASDSMTVGGSALTKDLSDSTTPSDSITLSPTKILADSVYPVQPFVNNANFDFETLPSPNTAATNTAGRWIDGTAAGSSAATGLGWATVAGALTASAEAAFDTSKSHTGSASLRLSTLNAAGSIVVGYKTNPMTLSAAPVELFPVLPSTTYKFTAFMQTDNVTTNGAFLDVREFNSSAGTITTTSSNKLSGTNATWQTLTITVTTNASTRWIGFLVRLNVPGNVSSLWIDDIYVLGPGFSKAVGKGSTDSATASDASVRSSSHPIADTATATEQITKSPVKKPADSVTASDNQTSLLAKNWAVADSVTPSDSNSKVVGKPLSDSASAADAISKSDTKSLADTASASDTITKSPAHKPTDSITASDANAKSFTKYLTDSVFATHGVNWTLNLVDSVTVSDNRTITTVTAHTLAPSDVVSANDFLVKSIGVSRSDSATGADALAKSSRKNLADSVTLTDSALPSRKLEDFVQPMDLIRVFLNGVGVVVPAYRYREKPHIGVPPRTPLVDTLQPRPKIYTPRNGFTLPEGYLDVDADDPLVDADADVPAGYGISRPYQDSIGIDSRSRVPSIGTVKNNSSGIG